MNEYKVDLKTLLSKRILYVCPTCLQPVMFPMLSPLDAKHGVQPLARCSKCFTLCPSIIGLDLDQIGDKDGQRIQADVADKRKRPDSTLESYKGEALEDVQR